MEGMGCGGKASDRRIIVEDITGKLLKGSLVVL